MENKIPIIIFTTRDSEFYGRKGIEETWLSNIDSEKYICLWHETIGRKNNPIHDLDSVLQIFDNILDVFDFPYCLLISDSCYLNVEVLENFDFGEYLIAGSSYQFTKSVLKDGIFISYEYCKKIKTREANIGVDEYSIEFIDLKREEFLDLDLDVILTPHRYWKFTDSHNKLQSNPFIFDDISSQNMIINVGLYSNDKVMKKVEMLVHGSTLPEAKTEIVSKSDNIASRPKLPIKKVEINQTPKRDLSPTRKYLRDVTLVFVSLFNSEYPSPLQKNLEVTLDKFDFYEVLHFGMFNYGIPYAKFINFNEIVLNNQHYTDLLKDDGPYQKYLSLEKYTTLLYEIGKYIDSEFVIFNTWDSFMINSDAWDDIFLKYDYINSITSNKKNNIFTDHLDYSSYNYNGNFHLRSKKLIDFIREYSDILSPRDSLNWKSPENYISSYRPFLEDYGNFRFSTPSVSKKWSVNGEKWNGQLGFSGFYTDLSSSELYKKYDLRILQNSGFNSGFKFTNKEYKFV